MLRVLSFVCVAGCALCVALSPAPCAAGGVTSSTAWPSPSQHAPAGADVWTPSPDTSVSAVRESGATVGHGRLVAPQVWERYSRRPVMRTRGAAVTPPVMPQELTPVKPVKKTTKPRRVAAPQTAPKKTDVSTPPKQPVETAPQPTPVDTVSPAPAPVAPAPIIAKEEAQPKAVTPPAVPEPDNVSASWIIRRDPALSQGGQPAPAAPSPAPAPQTPPASAPAAENTANPGATISAPWIMSTPAAPAASAGTASGATPAAVSPEPVPATPGA